MTTPSALLGQELALAALEALAVPVFVKGLDRRYQWCNRAFERLFDRPLESLVGKAVFDLVPETAAEDDRRDAELLERGQPLTYENQGHDPEGRPRVMRVDKAPLRDGRGGLVGIVGVVQDITARREVERSMRTLVDNLPDMITRFDRDGRLALVNRAVERVFGHPLEEFTGRALAELGPVEEREQQRELQTRVRQAFAEGTSNSAEVHWQTAWGPRWFELLHIPERDADGRVASVLGICHDITERRLAEERLRHLLHAVEESPVSIAVTDRAGEIVFVNRRFCEVTGHSAAEALGKRPQDLDEALRSEETYRSIAETLRDGREWRGELLSRRKSGEPYWERGSVSPVRDASGEVSHFVAVWEDVTERRRLEQQYQQAAKMEAIGQLAGGVAHDFNNMLGVILGNVELVLTELAPGSPTAGNLLEIREAARRSAELTQKLLAFARKQIIAPQVLDLNDTVEGMLKMVRRLIGEDIALEWLPGKGLGSVKMDPSQLDQVLVNLCVNARDAIAGVGRIAIQTRAESVAPGAEPAGVPAGDYLVLEVSDTGRGMDRQTLARAFEPFFTTKELGKGTGLGLSTVYGIVQQNGGFLDVRSEPGQGSTFRIHLPRCTAPRSAARPEAAAAPERGSETLLLVEDEPAILRVSQLMLERCGYRVLTAATPAEALRLAREHPQPIHLLITDVVMPGMDGTNLADELVALRPHLKRIFMSGYPSGSLSRRSELAPDVHFLQKPFSMPELTRMVRSVLDG